MRTFILISILLCLSGCKKYISGYDSVAREKVKMSEFAEKINALDMDSLSYQQNITKLIKEAMDGDEGAQFNLGKIYWELKNYEESYRWFELAANKGIAAAQYMVAVCYMNGYGVVANRTIAEQWLSRAAVKHYSHAVDAFILLAQHHYFDYAVQDEVDDNVLMFSSTDTPRSIDFPNLGATPTLNNVSQQNERSELAKNNKEKAQPKPPQRLSRQQEFEEALAKNPPDLQTLEQLAKSGSIESQLTLSSLYLDGKRVKKDIAASIYWLKTAAQGGNATAQNNLGSAYANGDGVDKSMRKAVYWYTRAAQQGYALAQYNLGAAYAIGSGVNRDFKQAYAWLYLASQSYDNSIGSMGNKLNEALFKLANLLEQEDDLLSAQKLADIYKKKYRRNNG